NVASGTVAMHRGSPGTPLPLAWPAGGLDVPARFVPLILFHGDQDRIVHKVNADQVIQQWVAAYKALTNGQQVQVAERGGQVPGGRAYTRATYADSARQTLIEQWTIHGGDHAWAGGSAQVSWTDPQGPNASPEIVRFFLAHPR